MVRMINKAITSPIYEAIQAYVERHKSEAIRGDKLLDEDWTTLYNIHEFLD
jgi:hypothetical protein